MRRPLAQAEGEGTHRGGAGATETAVGWVRTFTCAELVAPILGRVAAVSLQILLKLQGSCSCTLPGDRRGWKSIQSGNSLAGYLPAVSNTTTTMLLLGWTLRD